MVRFFGFVLFWGSPHTFMVAQDTLFLNNPSFEAPKPAHSTLPYGWLDAGEEAQSLPDIQPGYFGVSLKPHDGKTYLGLVTREDGTREAVAQQLNGYLTKDSTYSFNIWLARSNSLYSFTMPKMIEKHFKSPTILKIFGYNTASGNAELLAESTAIGHSKWLQYSFELVPTVDNFNMIELVAYYVTEDEKTNGNLMLDQCSHIIKVKK